MAPNPNYMADEVVREKTLRLCLSNIIHANRKRRLLMDMAVNNLLARRRQKMHLEKFQINISSRRIFKRNFESA
jgi:hypothetical protein